MKNKLFPIFGKFGKSRLVQPPPSTVNIQYNQLIDNRQVHVKQKIKKLSTAALATETVTATASKKQLACRPVDRSRIITQQQQVLRLARQYQQITTNQVERKLALAKSTAQMRINELIEQKKLRKVGEARNTSYRLVK